MPDASVYSIRRYEPGDYEDVWHLHLEGVRQTRTIAPELPGYDDDLRDIEPNYLADGSNFWVTETPDGLVGMTALQRVDDRTGRLRRMRVTTAWRKRGVARALLDVAVEFCRAKGYDRMILDTTEQQADAHRLYERYGFTRTGERMLGPFRVFDYEMLLR
jgi:GNAT superfamily N-acetyltransferase